MRAVKAINWLIALVGVWQIVSPFVLGFSSLSIAQYSSIIAGALLLILGAWAALSNNTDRDRLMDWVAAIIGIWLIAAPFVLGFSAISSIAMVNSVVFGAIALILGLVAVAGYRLAVTGADQTIENASAAVSGAGAGSQIYGQPSEVQTREPWNVSGPFSGVGPERYQVRDDRIEENIVDRLTQAGQLDASKIDVAVKHGDVTLMGMVPHDEDKQLAEDIAKSVRGVRNVRNDLSVEHREQHS